MSSHIPTSAYPDLWPDRDDILANGNDVSADGAAQWGNEETNYNGGHSWGHRDDTMQMDQQMDMDHFGDNQNLMHDPRQGFNTNNFMDHPFQPASFHSSLLDQSRHNLFLQTLATYNDNTEHTPLPGNKQDILDAMRAARAKLAETSELNTESELENTDSDIDHLIDPNLEAPEPIIPEKLDRFPDLPAECRIKIWKTALGGQNTIELYIDRHVSTAKRATPLVWVNGHKVAKQLDFHYRARVQLPGHGLLGACFESREFYLHEKPDTIQLQARGQLIRFNKEKDIIDVDAQSLFWLWHYKYALRPALDLSRGLMQNIKHLHLNLVDSATETATMIQLEKDVVLGFEMKIAVLEGREAFEPRAAAWKKNHAWNATVSWQREELKRHIRGHGPSKFLKTFAEKFAHRYLEALGEDEAGKKIYQIEGQPRVNVSYGPPYEGYQGELITHRHIERFVLYDRKKEAGEKKAREAKKAEDALARL